jgi:peptidoglycan hydrolase CwlO-like protein
MDAVVAAESTGYTINPLVTLGERVSTLEGTIENQNRIFDMLHEGQKTLMRSIAELRSETSTRITEMDVRINETNERINETNERINETNERIAAMELTVNERIAAMELTVNKHIAAMNSQLNSKIDSNLKWILGVQIAMWVTIIVAVLL